MLTLFKLASGHDRIFPLFCIYLSRQTSYNYLQTKFRLYIEHVKRGFSFLTKNAYLSNQEVLLSH